MTVSATSSLFLLRARTGKQRSIARQYGATLLESIAFLGIAAIVILSAVSLLTGAFSTAQSNRASQEVVAIRTAVRKLYMGQGYGTAGLNAALIGAKAFPSGLSTVGATVNNGFGGTVTVTGATTQFTIRYTNVPQDACIGTISGATGWASVTGGGGAAVTLFPVSVAAATAQCAAAVNTITFTSN